MVGIRRGVSLYSLQDSYGRGGLGLEGVVSVVEEMGTQGIEILSDEMIRGAQNASEETLAEWDRIIAEHPLSLVANDIFINSNMYRNRWWTLEEQVASLEADLRLSHRLGFPLVRLVSRTSPAVIRPALPLAEKLGVSMAIEVHAGMSFGDPITQAWIDEMYAVDSPHVGLVVDTGIFCERHPRIATNYFRSMGLSEEVAQYIDDVFASGTDTITAWGGRKGGRSVSEQQYVDYPKALLKLFRGPIDEFYAGRSTGYENTTLDVLDEYLPWIKSFHGKFYEMTDEGTEYSIDYSKIIARLKSLGFSGYICSEYEGQRFVVPGDPIDDVGQLRKHQELLDRLISERA